MSGATAWLLAAALLMLGLIPCGIVVVRGKALERVVALQAGSVIAVLAMLVYEQGVGRPSFFDLSLALAVLSFPSALLYAHFYERWL